MVAFGATEEVPYDSSGRIVLPADDAPRGGDRGSQLFIGGETFQL
jgi:MraZ protein